MNTKFDFAAKGEKIVYVRPVAVSTLPREVRSQADGAETLYAVHDEDGVPLALVANLRMAVDLARDNEMTPGNAHGSVTPGVAVDFRPSRSWPGVSFAALRSSSDRR